MISEQRQWASGNLGKDGWDYEFVLGCHQCHMETRLQLSMMSTPSVELVTRVEADDLSTRLETTYSLVAPAGHTLVQRGHTCYYTTKALDEASTMQGSLHRLETMVADLLAKDQELERLRCLVEVLRDRLVLANEELASEELARTKAALEHHAFNCRLP